MFVRRVNDLLRKLRSQGVLFTRQTVVIFAGLALDIHRVHRHAVVVVIALASLHQIQVGRRQIMMEMMVIVPYFLLNNRTRRRLRFLLRFIVGVARHGTSCAALDVQLLGMMIACGLLELGDIEMVLKLMMVIVGELMFANLRRFLTSSEVTRLLESKLEELCQNVLIINSPDNLRSFRSHSMLDTPSYSEDPR